MIATTSEVFEYHSSGQITGSFEDDVRRSVRLLSKLKGVGPATASLILSCYDLDNVPFFSDELYRWLHLDEEEGSSWDLKIKYTPNEYESLYNKAHSIMKDFEFEKGQKITAFDLEKAAYVLGKQVAGSLRGKGKKSKTEGASSKRQKGKRKASERDGKDEELSSETGKLAKSNKSEPSSNPPAPHKQNARERARAMNEVKDKNKDPPKLLTPREEDDK